MRLNVIRWGGMAGILAGLMLFLGYAGFAKLLIPVISQLGGHVVLGLAGLAILSALMGLFARDAGRTALPGTAGYALASVGAAVFSVGNLAEGIWGAEFGVRLFALGIMTLVVGLVLLGVGILRAKLLPPWGAWPLVVGWAAFLPFTGISVVLGIASGATNAHGLLWVAWALSSAGLLGTGWVTLGYALWSYQDESVGRTTP